MEFEEALRRRQTTRDYAPDAVDRADIEKLINAAHTAPLPAGYGDKTILAVVSGEDLTKQFREGMSLKRKDGTSVDPFYGAPVIIFVAVTEKSSDYIEYSNVGCIIENMLLEASALGLGGTYIWGSLRKLRANHELLTLLGLPEGYEVISAAAFGYAKKPLDIRHQSEKLQVKWL